jgi:hypothetical protein
MQGEELKRRARAESAALDERAYRRSMAEREPVGLMRQSRVASEPAPVAIREPRTTPERAIAAPPQPDPVEFHSRAIEQLMSYTEDELTARGKTLQDRDIAIARHKEILQKSGLPIGLDRTRKPVDPLDVETKQAKLALLNKQLNEPEKPGKTVDEEEKALKLAAMKAKVALMEKDLAKTPVVDEEKALRVAEMKDKPKRELAATKVNLDNAQATFDEAKQAHDAILVSKQNKPYKGLIKSTKDFVLGSDEPVPPTYSEEDQKAAIKRVEYAAKQLDAAKRKYVGVSGGAIPERPAQPAPDAGNPEPAAPASAIPPADELAKIERILANHKAGVKVVADPEKLQMLMDRKAFLTK